ncbi:MAG: hypothetical protein H6Q17_2011 [Bacteroidetes bacterium]|nr:hypothetical protein [Bacteroidota bacterium]
MNYTLESLKVSNLTLLEVGQLINRHQQDIGSLDPALITDPPLKNYLTVLFTQNVTFTQGLMKTQKDERTELLEDDDSTRDKSLATFGKAIRLSLDSDNEEEAAAAKSLSILLNTYKDIADLPYEAETLAMDKLVAALESSEYSSKVSATNNGKYVSRMKSANETFKAHFGDRSTTESLAYSINNKKARKELLDYYGEALDYLVSMANAHKTEQFAKTLALINGGRKYYADTLAHRAGVAKAKTEEVKK